MSVPVRTQAIDVDGIFGESGESELIIVALLWSYQESNLQCKSKKSPLQFSDIFSQTVGNF